MEQQEVTIAKGGICATLPARTTVLAAANPAGGHFDRSKTLAENLKMSAAMLSRFDLSFLLSDRPDQAWDQHLSEHVIAAHSGRKPSLTFKLLPLSSISSFINHLTFAASTSIKIFGTEPILSHDVLLNLARISEEPEILKCKEGDLTDPSRYLPTTTSALCYVCEECPYEDMLVAIQTLKTSCRHGQIWPCIQTAENLAVQHRR